MRARIIAVDEGMRTAWSELPLRQPTGISSLRRPRRPCQPQTGVAVGLRKVTPFRSSLHQVHVLTVLRPGSFTC